MVSGKETSTKIRPLKPCPREGCGGQMRKEGEVWECLQCSRTWQAPRDKHKYIEAHRFDIEEDYAKEGSVFVQKKWGISPAGWFTIRKRWKLGKGEKPVYEAITPIKHTDEELVYLRGYKACLDDLLKGGVEISLRIIDNTLVLENNEKVRSKV